MAKIVGGTSKCIRCKGKAVAWGGHVKGSDGNDILAGWCSKHRNGTWPGWFGYHQPWMGKEVEAGE